MRPTGLGSGIDKDRPGYTVCTGEWEVGSIYQTRGGPGSAGYAFGICAWAALIAITLATAASTSIFIVVLVSICSPRRAVMPVGRFAPRAGLVTLRQTFVRRRHRATFRTGAECSSKK